jgi:hypothetical protein
VKTVDLDMLANDIADVLNGEDYEALSAHGVPASAVRAALEPFLTAVSAAQAATLLTPDATPLPTSADPQYVRAGEDSYMLEHLLEADWADEVYDVHSYGRRLGSVQRIGEEWSASPLPTGSGSHGPCASRTSALIRLSGLTQESQR